MNEADTRAELIDPKLKASGWGVVPDSKIRREYYFTKGEIKPGGKRAEPKKADYILIYKKRKIAVVEAKPDEDDVSEGVAQAKDYADRLRLHHAYSSNGKSIYQIKLKVGEDNNMIVTSEGDTSRFPTPDELWNETYKEKNEWLDNFHEIPFERFKEDDDPRYYNEISTNLALEAIAKKKKRLLLTLATGTGKTVIAFNIAWKLFKARWNINYDGKRQPRILFLADRNILANQAFKAFNLFQENALVRIRPEEIAKKGKVPMNGSIFFTIFQTFMSGRNGSPYFGEYPKDFFDLVIIDECHRGGAKDESAWRDILNYFSDAVHIGLTATPKRDANIDTYNYFGEPIYTYSLKQGIQDGFLTPFKVRIITTTLDEYVYEPDDEILEGEIEDEGKIYRIEDFNRNIEIEARERNYVKLLLENINPKEKTLVFCANQAHAAKIRDYINQASPNVPIDYCVRVTANDGKDGETFLRIFQDNEKKIPTILTTSRKLSTGVDALNVRNIVLLRPVKSMVEFKQIIGRGTRLFEGKYFFTIIDFVRAHEMFKDDAWDGEPAEPTTIVGPDDPLIPPQPPEPPDITPDDEDEDDENGPTRNKVKIKLAKGKELEIKDTKVSLFYIDGESLTAQEFIKKIFNTLQLPDFFNDEKELIKIWSSPVTRNELLKKLSNNGIRKEELKTLQGLIDANDSDLFDVLEYIAFLKKPISRQARAEEAENNILNSLSENEKEFIEFVLEKYVEGGVEELDISRLGDLIKLKYHTTFDGIQKLGGDEKKIYSTFVDFQKYLYEQNENRQKI